MIRRFYQRLHAIPTVHWTALTYRWVSTYSEEEEVITVHGAEPRFACILMNITDDNENLCIDEAEASNAVTCIECLNVWSTIWHGQV